MSNAFHLKRSSTGHLLFHYNPSSHRLCRTGNIGGSTSTYPRCGAQVRDSSYDGAANSAVAAMAVGVTYGYAPAESVACSVLRAEDLGGPIATAEISVSEFIMKWPYSKIYGSITTGGNVAGTVNVATSETRLGNDPRTLTPNVYSGDGSLLDGLWAQRYVYIWGVINDWTPPGNYAFQKRFTISNLLYLSLIV